MNRPYPVEQHRPAQCSWAAGSAQWRREAVAKARARPGRGRHTIRLEAAQQIRLHQLQKANGVDRAVGAERLGAPRANQL